MGVVPPNRRASPLRLQSGTVGEEESFSLETGYTSEKTQRQKINISKSRRCNSGCMYRERFNRPIQGVIMQTEEASAQAAAVPTLAVNPAEAQLVNDIGELWQIHSQAQGTLRKTRDELKLMRTTLAERLFELKSILSCPGRAGQWSSFLGSKGIPRTSADRLVSAHEKSLGQDRNGSSGATKKLSDDGIAQVAKTTWARLGKQLGTHEAIYQFFSKLIIESGIPFDTFDDGILILLPVAAPELTAATAPVEDVVKTTTHTESSPTPADGALLSGVTQ